MRRNSYNDAEKNRQLCGSQREQGFDYGRADAATESGRCPDWLEHAGLKELPKTLYS